MGNIVSETRYQFWISERNSRGVVRTKCRFYHVIRVSNGETCQMLIKEYNRLGTLVDTDFIVYEEGSEMSTIADVDIILEWVKSRKTTDWTFDSYSFGYVELEMWPYIVNRK